MTIGQWVEFLNAKEKTELADPNARLFFPAMTTDWNIAGIRRLGSQGSYRYEAIASSERPVTYVSWLGALRFVNWLHNGKGSGDTEGGVYDLSLPADQITRSPGAIYYLPSEDEWYKAAYYDPTKGGSNYWLYATLSDTQPDNTLSVGANHANFANVDYTMTPGDGYSSTQQYLHNVGSFTGSSSHYGTFDQTGSVWEFMEDRVGVNTVTRGGSWGNNHTSLPATVRTPIAAIVKNSNYGIRLAKPVP